MSNSAYQQDIGKCAANFKQLPFLSFIRQLVQLYPHHDEVVQRAGGRSLKSGCE